jgi:hypothetical protein
MNIATMANAAETQENSAHKDYRWTLKASQKLGNLWLYWSSTAPFRAQQGQIAVYAVPFPTNPLLQQSASSVDFENGGGSGWNTGLPWGSDWNCAWIAQQSPNGPYTYAVRLTTTAEEE